jgi:hypothetical protein
MNPMQQQGKFLSDSRLVSGFRNRPAHQERIIHMKRFAFTVFGCSLLASVALAQMPGGQPPPDPCAALAKFLTKDVAFTATAKVVRARQTMVLYFAVSGGNMRNEMDMTKMSGAGQRFGGEETNGDGQDGHLKFSTPYLHCVSEPAILPTCPSQESPTAKWLNRNRQ